MHISLDSLSYAVCIVFHLTQGMYTNPILKPSAQAFTHLNCTCPYLSFILKHRPSAQALIHPTLKPSAQAFTHPTLKPSAQTLTHPTLYLHKPLLILHLNLLHKPLLILAFCTSPYSPYT